MSGIEVSVIVPVRDDEARLARLLESLRAQTLAPERYEVIVVANACRDASAATALAGGARVVEVPLPNRARARNAGARVARGARLAFTDADCVATPTWLEALLGAATDPLVAGRVRITTAPEPNAVERLERLWRFDQSSWVAQGWAATANLLVERGAFEAIGGFDCAYRHTAEDADLCLRAGRAGHALSYCDAAEVLHPAETRMWPMLKRFFWHGYGSAQAHARIGEGEHAWRNLRPLARPQAALAAVGAAHVRDRRVGRLAQAGYAFRVAGSVWRDLPWNRR